jgi:hypothetical protein
VRCLVILRHRKGSPAAHSRPEGLAGGLRQPINVCRDPVAPCLQASMVAVSGLDEVAVQMREVVAQGVLKQLN